MKWLITREKELRRFIQIVALAIIIYNLFAISDYLIDRYENKRTVVALQSMYEEVQEELQPLSYSRFSQPVHDTGVAIHRDNRSNNISQNSGLTDPSPQTRFGQLEEISKDIVGWISIPNTDINYPVVQTTDNAYYLTHTVTHRKSGTGAIFMDYRNDALIQDFNTIIYGHNLRDGSMFRELMEYKDSVYFDENTIITYETPQSIMEWQIFSVYVTEVDFNYIEPNFEHMTDRIAFLDELKERSMHRSNVVLDSDTQILTLSTCEYSFDDVRLVVHAKLISEQANPN